MRLPLLLAFLLASSAHADLPGLFTGCKVVLQEILDEREAIYQADAEALSIESPEEQREYVQRRARVRYLLMEVARSAVGELEEMMPVLGAHGHFIDFRNELEAEFRRKIAFQDEGQQPVMDSAVADMNRKANQVLLGWFEEKVGEKRRKDLHPFSYQLISARPPTTQHEISILKRLGLLRAGLAQMRGNVSNEFAKLSAATTVDKLDPASLEKARQRGTAQALSQLDSVGKHLGMQDVLRPLKDCTAGGVEYDNVAQQLLVHPALSTAVKAEISIQLDFQKRYGFPMENTLKVYMEEVMDYFDIVLKPI